MDVVSAKTIFFGGITLSFCPCGYAQPPEGEHEQIEFRRIRFSSRAPIGSAGGKAAKAIGEIIAIIPWAEAHGYKGCVLSGRDSASHLIYLRMEYLRVPNNFCPVYCNRLQSVVYCKISDKKTIV